MGLETAGASLYLNGLNPSWPDGAVDQRSQGDDHLRVIKRALKNTFPNLTGAVTVTQTELNYLSGATANIQTMIAQAMPSGTIIQSARSAASTGWLLCDGSVVSRTTYADLFAAIGTTYGAGDGSTTFGLPDGRGRAFIGAGTGSGLTPRVLGATGGEETHQLSVAELAQHNHGITDPGHAHTGSTGSAGAHTHLDVNTSVWQWEIRPVVAEAYGNVFGSHSDGAHTHTVSVGSSATGVSVNNSGSDTPHNNMQPFIVGNWMIKT